MSFTVQQVFTGDVGAPFERQRILSDDNLATITTPGYLNPSILQGYNYPPTAEICVSYIEAGVNALGYFMAVPDSNGILTLVPAAAISLDAIIKDPADDQIIEEHDLTLANGNLTAENLIAANGNITSTLGDVIAGSSGNDGVLVSFPPSATKGSLQVKAADNVGDTITTLTNSSMNQATTFVLPDPGGASANILVHPGTFVDNNLVVADGTLGKVADAGFAILSNTTAVYGGGGTSNTFVAVGLTVAAKGSAVIRTSTNSVSITKAVPGSGTLAITFSADPGAGTTVDWIYTTATAAP